MLERKQGSNRFSFILDYRILVLSKIFFKTYNVASESTPSRMFFIYFDFSRSDKQIVSKSYLEKFLRDCL